MNVGSLREALWARGEGVIQGVEVLSRRVVYVSGRVGRSLHVVEGVCSGRGGCVLLRSSHVHVVHERKDLCLFV